MSEPERINITSKHQAEFETSIEIGKERFIVQTEDLGLKKHEVVTSVYQNGRIVKTIRTNYSSIIDLKDFTERLHSLMQRQHKTAVQDLRQDKDRSPALYMEELNLLIKKKHYKSALCLITEALESYPDDPFLLSYHGMLLSHTEKQHEAGIKLCLGAIERLKKNLPFGEEFFYPLFYLNLGRAYLAAGMKKEAYEAFSAGLTYDRHNHDLRWELKKMGSRKKPVIPFLPRGSFINKYLGMLRKKIKG